MVSSAVKGCEILPLQQTSGLLAVLYAWQGELLLLLLQTLSMDE